MPSKTAAPSLIIVMGVSGCGKSTLADALAKQWAFNYLEADDFHSEQSKQKMAAGIPLNEQDRLPWIDAMCQFLLKGQQNTVLAYSGLKKNHRECFRQIGFNTHFIYLQGSSEDLLRRINSRSGHFMPASLLESQLNAMEAPDGEHDISSIDIGQQTSLAATVTLAEQFIFDEIPPD